jgi:hypothetical protein
MNRPRDIRRPDEQTVEEIFDEALAKILAEERERERRGEPPPPRPPLPADVAQAGEALEAMFGGNYHLTADLSFDQVYAKVRPHLETIWNYLQREQQSDRQTGIEDPVAPGEKDPE